MKELLEHARGAEDLREVLQRNVAGAAAAEWIASRDELLTLARDLILVAAREIYVSLGGGHRDSPDTELSYHVVHGRRQLLGRQLESLQRVHLA